jgi:hypothetical protein
LDVGDSSGPQGCQHGAFRDTAVVAVPIVAARFLGLLRVFFAHRMRQQLVMNVRDEPEIDDHAFLPSPASTNPYGIRTTTLGTTANIARRIKQPENRCGLSGGNGVVTRRPLLM